MKCHKLEINIRKELQRQLNSVNNQLKQEELYLTKSYEKRDRAFTQKQIDILTAQKQVLTEVMQNAVNNTN